MFNLLIVFFKLTKKVYALFAPWTCRWCKIMKNARAFAKLNNLWTNIKMEIQHDAKVHTSECAGRAGASCAWRFFKMSLMNIILTYKFNLCCIADRFRAKMLFCNCGCVYMQRSCASAGLISHIREYLWVCLISLKDRLLWFT